jgi:hypothetical protein
MTSLNVEDGLKHITSFFKETNQVKNANRLISNFNKFLSLFNYNESSKCIIDFFRSIKNDYDTWSDIEFYKTNTTWAKAGSIKVVFHSVNLALDCPQVIEIMGNEWVSIKNEAVKLQRHFAKLAKDYDVENETKSEHKEYDTDLKDEVKNQVNSDNKDVEDNDVQEDEEIKEVEEVEDDEVEVDIYDVLKKLEEVVEENKVLKHQNKELKRALTYFTTRALSSQAFIDSTSQLIKQNDDYMLKMLESLSQ